MHILLVAATKEEIPNIEIQSPNLEVESLITGVGMTATAYALTKALCKKKYDYAINIGLAGSFHDEIKIGDVVAVVSDMFADLGAEDGEEYLSVFEMGLQKGD